MNAIPTRSTQLALLVATALTGAVAFGATASAAELEKCYGVAAAGHNDCKTATNSCAGHVTKDRDPHAFVALPAGTCGKIAGGKTEPAK